MPHKVYLTFFSSPEVHEFETWEGATEFVEWQWELLGKVYQCRLVPDYALFSDLADYVAAWNAEEDWMESKYGPPRTQHRRVNRDIRYWHNRGITTPAELALHLAIGSYKDLYADRHDAITREDLSSFTVEEIVAKTEALAGGPGEWFLS